MSPIDEIRDALEDIRAVADDPEVAHIRQDTFVKIILRRIAAGVDDPQTVAVEAMKVYDIDFPRWYA